MAPACSPDAASRSRPGSSQAEMRARPAPERIEARGLVRRHLGRGVVAGQQRPPDSQPQRRQQPRPVRLRSAAVSWPVSSRSTTANTAVSRSACAISRTARGGWLAGRCSRSPARRALDSAGAMSDSQLVSPRWAKADAVSRIASVRSCSASAVLIGSGGSSLTSLRCQISSRPALLGVSGPASTLTPKPAPKTAWPAVERRLPEFRAAGQAAHVAGHRQRQPQRGAAGPLPVGQCQADRVQPGRSEAGAAGMPVTGR